MIVVDLGQDVDGFLSKFVPHAPGDLIVSHQDTATHGSMVNAKEEICSSSSIHIYAMIAIILKSFKKKIHFLDSRYRWNIYFISFVLFYR